MSGIPHITRDELGGRLRTARERAALSQRELAAELGASERSIQDYEAGAAWPRPEMRRRILAFIASVEDGVAA